MAQARRPTRAKPVKKGKRRSLKDYQAKRNFAVTPEPSGGAAKAGRGGAKAAKSGAAKKPAKKPVRTKAKPAGPIFVVQKHLASHLHYDFRLEHGGVLLSWAVPKGPSLNPRDKRLAMRVEDHPLDYADFEGVIPEGYGAGIVMVWDNGTWAPEPGFEDIDAALAKGELKLRLEGVKLKGSWVLVRTGGRGGDGGGGGGGAPSRSWLLIKHKDDWAGAVDVTEAAPLSVKSFKDFPEILAANTPAVWESHRPARGGATGAMLAEIIEKAGKIKAGKRKKKQ